MCVIIIYVVTCCVLSIVTQTIGLVCDLQVLGNSSTRYHCEMHVTQSDEAQCLHCSEQWPPCDM